MALYPTARQRPVLSHSGNVSGYSGLVLHGQQGDGSPYGRFSNPDNKASSHLWVSKSGEVEQYVDTGLRAWAQVDGNALWTSVETEGFGVDSGLNHATALTDAQIASLAALYRWGHETHGWPYQLADEPSATGFGVHYMGGAAWGGHPCPGPIRAGQREQILQLAASVTQEQAMTLVIQPVGAVRQKDIDTNGWAFGARGHVYAFGAAPYFGGWDDNTRADPNRVCVALVPTLSGNGYWLVSNFGETYAFADAPQVGNYQAQWGPGVIIGAVLNSHTQLGGVSLVRDDGHEINLYALPAQ